MILFADFALCSWNENIFAFGNINNARNRPFLGKILSYFGKNRHIRFWDPFLGIRSIFYPDLEIPPEYLTLNLSSSK